MIYKSVGKMAKFFKLTKKKTGLGERDLEGGHLNSGESDGVLSPHHTQARGPLSMATMLPNWGAGCRLLYL